MKAFEQMPENQPRVTIQSRKYDGRKHRQWEARLLRREGTLLLFEAKFTEEVNHPLLGHIPVGTGSLEYYWSDRWYNIFRFSDLSGNLRYYYCNVNIPPSFDGQTLSYVDLDMDILVAPDHTFQLLDKEEFESNTLTYEYPDTVVRSAHKAVEELEVMIKTRQFPFDE